MFKLTLDRANFLRVRRGVTKSDIERVYGCPVLTEIFEGGIIRVNYGELVTYTVKAGESLKSIAKKFEIEEEQIVKLNGDVIYPTKIIYLSKK